MERKHKISKKPKRQREKENKIRNERGLQIVMNHVIIAVVVAILQGSQRGCANSRTTKQKRRIVRFHRKAKL